MAQDRPDGSGDDFGEYVAARWPRLVRAAVLLGCTPHEAEDVVQSALTRCLVKWSRVSRADDRDAYVHRVVVNTFIDHRRRMWRHEVPTERLPDRTEADGSLAVIDQIGVDRALAGLVEDQRIAVVLRYYLDLSEAQMAAVLGIAPGTVKSRLSRALAALGADANLTQEEPWTPSS